MAQAQTVSFGKLRVTIAKNVRRLLVRQHMSIRYLSARSGIARPTVSRLLGGKMSRIDLRIVVAVAQSLGTTAANLMSEREAAMDVVDPLPLRTERLILDD